MENMQSAKLACGGGCANMGRAFGLFLRGATYKRSHGQVRDNLGPGKNSSSQGFDHHPKRA